MQAEVVLSLVVGIRRKLVGRFGAHLVALLLEMFEVVCPRELLSARGTDGPLRGWWWRLRSRSEIHCNSVDGENAVPKRADDKLTRMSRNDSISSTFIYLRKFQFTCTAFD